MMSRVSACGKGRCAKQVAPSKLLVTARRFHVVNDDDTYATDIRDVDGAILLPNHH
jgi:hypothetical protein